MIELVGKTVKRILIKNDDEVIVFETDLGHVAYETEGDCCSNTWFESITGVKALIGEKVLTQESVALPEPNGRSYVGDHYVEELKDYGVKLTTSKGYVDLVYRNSSNGYYGGRINLLNQVPSIYNFKEITDDWTAA